MKNDHSQTGVLRLALLTLAIPFTAASNAQAIHPDKAAAEHVSQATLFNMVKNNSQSASFLETFEIGDELFGTAFNYIDGVGAKVGQGFRFSRVPRPDLSNGSDLWSDHIPKRETGPNGRACNECHLLPFEDGAGTAALNVHRNPTHSLQLFDTITRNTPHLFGLGALQRLAEEMTETLHKTRDKTIAKACRNGNFQVGKLRAKGVDFGIITVDRASAKGQPCKTKSYYELKGIDPDLVIKPLQWKGSDPTIRVFNRGASNNELGMQAVEITGDGVDGDGDGVTDEFTVGDMTAMAIYLAAQPRPVTKLELNKLGLLPVPLTKKEINSIRKGRNAFGKTGCTDCHRASMKIANPIFSEPSQNPNYRDTVFPAGQDPLTRKLDPAFAVTFDLTKDQPDNIITGPDGTTVRLGAFETDAKGRAIVRLFSDLKRHDMGYDLKESIDEVGTGASVWITKELWGVGSTAPYLHNGTATTLNEAIMAHGGEGQKSRDNYAALSKKEKSNINAFLNNLILLKLPEEP